MNKEKRQVEILNKIKFKINTEKISMRLATTNQNIRRNDEPLLKRLKSAAQYTNKMLIFSYMKLRVYANIWLYIYS